MPPEFKYRQQFYQDYFNSQSGRTFSLNMEAKIKSEEYLLAKEILPLMPNNLDAAILDIGCGFGSLIYMLKKNYQKFVAIKPSIFHLMLMVDDVKPVKEKVLLM